MSRATPDAVEVLEPMSGEQAQTYQRLRAYLAELRLSAAAESLTAVLDAAREQDLRRSPCWSGCSTSRSPPSTHALSVPGAAPRSAARGQTRWLNP